MPLRLRLLWRGLAAFCAIGLVMATASAEDTIKIGLLAPFSGPFADFGQQIGNGVDLYMRQHGDTIAGKKIVVLRRDTTGANPALAKRLAQELITRDHVAFLAGFGFTPNALAVAPIGTEAKVPMVIMNAATGIITQKSPYFVRFSFTQEQIVSKLGEWAAKNGLKKVFVASSDFAAGHESEAAFDKFFKAAGGQIVGSVLIPLNNPEFAPYVQRIADAKPQAVYLFVPTGVEPPAFIRQFNSMGLRHAGVKLLGGTDIIDDTAIETLGDEVLGVYTTMIYSADHQSALNRAYVKAYEAAYGPKPQPNFMSVGGYDGMHGIYEVITKLHGQIDPDKAMAAFKGLAFESPRGPIEIDPKTRDITQNVYIREAEKVNGKIVNREIFTFPMVKVPHS